MICDAISFHAIFKCLALGTKGFRGEMPTVVDQDACIRTSELDATREPNHPIHTHLLGAQVGTPFSILFENTDGDWYLEEEVEFSDFSRKPSVGVWRRNRLGCAALRRLQLRSNALFRYLA